MGAPKSKSVTSSAELDEKIAVLDRRGWHQHDIANEVGISQPMVCVRLRKMRASYHERVHKERQAAVDEKVAQLRDIRREAWAAYYRSMNDAEKEVQEWGVDKEAVGGDDFVTSEVMLKRIVTREGRLPDNAYLNTVLKTLDDERELLGLDECKPGLVTIEQAMVLVNAIKDAVREVLSDHPDLLKQVLQRTVRLMPLAEVDSGEVAG